jgi:hypothetical protein
MKSFYQRTALIERAEGDPEGHLAGTLATNGEASDGHILDIKTLKLQQEPPLLFGHDDMSGRNNLGKWTDFAKLIEGAKLGAQSLHGEAEIELGGEGAQLDWRKDMAHMIASRNIKMLSIRWTGEGVRRVNLSSDHPAFIDAKKLTDPWDPRRYGEWFENGEMLEGSVVTLGSDHEALIGRVVNTRGQLRQIWASAIARSYEAGEIPEAAAPLVGNLHEAIGALRAWGIDDLGTLLRLALHDDIDPRTLVTIEHPDGDKRIMIPRWAYDELRAGSEERLRTAFDLLVEDRTSLGIVTPPEPTGAAAPAAPATPPAPRTPEANGSAQGRPFSSEALMRAVSETNEGIEDANRSFVASTLKRLIHGV